MQNGVCYLRQELALPTCANVSGLSPNGETFFHTLTTTGLDGGSNSRRALKKRKAELMPTLTVCGNYNRKGASATSGDWLINQSEGTSGGALNPEWAEWFMGWPIGWIELKPLATGRFQQWQQKHGICF